MNKHLRDRVTICAQQVRDWAQERAEKSKYHPEDLLGWCAITAAELHKILKDQEIDSVIHVHNDMYSHAFVVVEDHVVDVTATQFREFADKPVVIMHKREAEVFDYYNTDEEFATGAELRKWQRKHKWPRNQIAYPT
jgi:hypothetical protein